MKRVLIGLSILIVLLLFGCQKSFTVTIKGFDGEIIFSESYKEPTIIQEPTAKEVDGYEFEGWFIGGEEFDFSQEVTSSITIEAFYSEDDRYKIVFVDENGEVLKTAKVEEGGNVNPPLMNNRFGYRFDGWDNDQAYRNVHSSATIKAIYRAVYGYATFYDMDGDVFKTIYYGGTTLFEPPVAPEVDGYTFVGWNNDFSSAVGNIDVHPVYKIADYKYKINYHMEGHSFEYSNIAKLKKDFLADVYAFLGTDSLLDEHFIYNDDINKKHYDYFINNPLYKAKWMPLIEVVKQYKNENNTWQEAFNKYFTEGNIIPKFYDDLKDYYIYEQYLLLPIVHEEGFIGWYTNDAFSGNAIYVVDTTTKEEINVYPRFVTSTTYTISFDTDGGNLIGAIDVEYGEIISLPAAFKVGYAFSGWQYNGEIIDDEIEFKENGDIMLKATYTSSKTSLMSGGSLVKDYNGKSIGLPNNYQERDSEMRAVWVSSYVSDFAPSANEDRMKKELNGILDTLEEMNMNTVIFHIRVNNDACYQTKLAPMNKNYGTYESFENWDYLTWFIEECHKRGIEFHAWLNPYRISSNGYSTSTTCEDVAKAYKDYPDNAASNPDNILMTYVNGTNVGAILNPGLEEVRKYIIKVCIEVMEKYDVDAIHFDDYFYARMSESIDVLKEADQKTYEDYISANPNCGYRKDNASDKANWRREQVDKFIYDLHLAMDEQNKKKGTSVELGISPTGIYNNGDGKVTYKADGTAISSGSSTRGQTHYSSYLFCDTKKWVDNEWIDYIVPQSYWSFGQSVACYANVVSWWAQIVKNKNVKLYVGMGLYMSLGSTSYTWSSDPMEAYNQVLYANQYPEIQGFSIFSYKSLVSVMQNKDAMAHGGIMKLRLELWKSKVSVPK